MWQQSQLPLARRVRDFLGAKGLEVVEWENLQNGFLGAQPQDGMVALVNEFHNRNPSFNTYDIALMLCCVHGYLPGSATTQVATAVPPEENLQKQLPDLLAQLDESETTRTCWHNWLAEIRDLPLEADDWDDTTVQAFTHAVQRLNQQRQQERQQRTELQARLVHVLTLLHEQATNELDYFGFAAAQTWSADHVAPSETAAVAEDVTNFYTQLMAHRAGLQQPPAETRAAQIARRNEIEALEEQIIEAYNQLNACFAVEPAAPAEQAALSEPAHTELASSEVVQPLLQSPELEITAGDVVTPLFSPLSTAPNGSAPNGARRGFFRRK